MSAEEMQFVFSVIDDHRRLIAAGKSQRWDIVKWAVTINVALAAASAALKQHVNAGGWLFFLALAVACLTAFLIREITRRMTETRNDSLRPIKYLMQNNIDVGAITGKLPDEYELSYDRQDLKLYAGIGVVSVVPALVIWVL